MEEGGKLFLGREERESDEHNALIFLIFLIFIKIKFPKVKFVFI